MFRVLLVLSCLLVVGVLLIPPCMAQSVEVNPGLVGAVQPPPTPPLPSETRTVEVSHEPMREWNVAETKFQTGGNTYRYKDGQLQVYQLTCAPGSRTCTSSWSAASASQTMQVNRARLRGGSRIRPKNWRLFGGGC